MDKELGKYKIQMIRDALEDSDLNQCSFQPKTNDRYISMDSLTGEIYCKQSAEKFKESIFDRLQISARSKKFRNRRDKDAEQLDFECNQDYCTFTPRINNFLAKSQKNDGFS